MARRLVEGKPGWRALLVDLRNHGQSRGFSPPHTVATAADDVRELLAQEQRWPRMVVGHSYGGKVALELAQSTAAAVDHLWLVDSVPGARPGGRGSESTLAVIRSLRELPERLPSKEAFIDQIVQKGHASQLAAWLAMNLERVDDQHRFASDLTAIEAMLEDYLAVDLWPLLPSNRGTVTHLVIGDRSEVFSKADRDRAIALTTSSNLVRVHVIPDAGHWVHVDAPDTLFDLIAGHTA